MKSNQQLIDEYLANGGKITICPSSEPKVSKSSKKTKLIPTEFIEYNYDGKRIYRNLNKFEPSASLDETVANYG